MNEELMQLDADIKGLFVEEKIEEIKDQLEVESDATIKEISFYNWHIIKKYFDNENFTLLFQHIRFVAYACFIIEYAHQRGLIGEDAFKAMILIFNDIYKLKKQNN